MSRTSLLVFSCFVGFFVCLLRFLPHEPIYIDEIGYLVLHGRVFSDQGKLISLLPQCASFESAPPFTWYPMLFLTGVIHDWWIDSYDALKILGGGGGLLLVVTFSFVYKALFLKPWTGWTSLIEAWGPFFIGSLPFVVTLFRPEAAVVTYVVLCVFFILKDRRSSRSNEGPAPTFFHAVFHVSAFSLHPVALLFLPLTIAAVWLSVRASIYRLLCIGIILFGVLESVHHYSSLVSDWSCPRATERLADISSPPKGWKASPLQLMKYVGNRLVSGMALGEMLSPDWILLRDSEGSNEVVGLSRGPITLLIILTFLTGLVQLGMTTLRMILGVLRHRRPDRESLVFLFLLLGTAISLCMRQTRVFYLAALYVPLWFFLLGLSWRMSNDGMSKLIRRMVRVLLVTISIFSLSSFLFNEDLRLNGSHRQTLSHLFRLPSYEFRPQMSRNDLYEVCGFARGQELKHLVLSDATYLYFRGSFEPFMIDYVSGEYWSGDILDLTEFLRTKDSSGVAVRCEELPVSLESVSTKVGEFCCVNREQLLRR